MPAETSSGVQKYGFNTTEQITKFWISGYVIKKEREIELVHEGGMRKKRSTSSVITTLLRSFTGC
jgi:hypothetical protein